MNPITTYRYVRPDGTVLFTWQSSDQATIWPDARATAEGLRIGSDIVLGPWRLEQRTDSGDWIVLVNSSSLIRLITEPGVYDLDPDVYHADPVAGGALSHSGIKRLLAPSCPALFKWWRDHPTKHSNEFDLGHVAHKLILGRGAAIAEIDAANYLTKKAKDAKAAAYEAGAIPVLPKELEQAQAMRAAVFEHPEASVLLDPKRGKAEQTLIWRHPQTGIMCRGMVDFLTDAVAGVPYFLPDYKTSFSAAPMSLSRIMANLGYHTAGAWYTSGVAALGIHPNPQYVLIVQEKTPPYLVTVAFPDAAAMNIGRERCRTAVDTFIECTKADQWPGYSTEPVYVSLPPWVERDHTLESW